MGCKRRRSRHRPPWFRTPARIKLSEWKLVRQDLALITVGFLVMSSATLAILPSSADKSSDRR